MFMFNLRTASIFSISIDHCRPAGTQSCTSLVLFFKGAIIHYLLFKKTNTPEPPDVSVQEQLLGKFDAFIHGDFFTDK